MTKIEKLISGKVLDIFALIMNRRCLVRDFIDGLQEDDQKKVIALLKRAADYGMPNNVEKFRKLDGDIWEFKSFQVRILCALEGREVVILTHGFIKKKDKTPAGEIRRAKELLAAWHKRR